MTEHPAEPPQPGVLVVSAAIFYAVMAAIGVAMIAAQDLEIGSLIFGDGSATLQDAGLGVGSGLGLVFLTWAMRRWPPMARLSAELRAVIGTPGTGAIAVLAVTSAVGEELLFRGAMQPLIGFWLTVAVFGLMHGGTSRRLWLWALFATAAGALLGALTEWTDNLLAPILCHLTVNFWNLHALARDEPSEATG